MSCNFRRKDGGLYSVYVAAYSRIYRACMHWLHRGVGAEIYCEITSPPMPIEEFASLVQARTQAMKDHCRSCKAYCTWCGRRRPAEPVSLAA